MSLTHTRPFLSRFVFLAWSLVLLVLAAWNSHASLVVANYRNDFRAQAPLAPG